MATARLYGPNVDVSGTATANEGLIPGREYIATLDDGSGRKNTVIAVQIPDSFDQAAPCLVLGPSSGSRGVYGAVAAASEWGLKHDCAVALTDAGKGVGLYDLTDDTVNRIDGTRATRAAGRRTRSLRRQHQRHRPRGVQRAVPEPARAEAGAFAAEPGEGLGQRHAGRRALCALRVERPLRQRRHIRCPSRRPTRWSSPARCPTAGPPCCTRPSRTASGLIDGVVAGEPVTEMPTTTGYGIQFGGVPVTGFGKTLADFTTYGNLYQPCAALAAPAAMTEADDLQLHGHRRHDRARHGTLRRPGRQGPGERRGHRRAVARRLEQAARLRLDDRQRPDAQRPLGPGQRADPVGDVPEHVRPLLGHRQRLQHQLRAGRRRGLADRSGRGDEGAELRGRQRHRQRHTGHASSTTTRSAVHAPGSSPRPCRPRCRTSASTTRCASVRW